MFWLLPRQFNMNAGAMRRDRKDGKAVFASIEVTNPESDIVNPNVGIISFLNTFKRRFAESASIIFYFKNAETILFSGTNANISLICGGTEAMLD